MKVTRILLTGFEPFGGDRINPSWEVARALDGATLEAGGHCGVVRAVCLPCVFGQSLLELQRALTLQPTDLVLSLGLGASRHEVTVERVAINVDDARIPDNAGRQPVDEPVVPGAPAAYFSSLPIKRMVAAVREAGIPASVSQTAGTYVCNHVLYGAAHWAATHQPGLRVGFMHLPLLHAQAVQHTGFAGMALPTLVDAVRVALCAALDPQGDIRMAAGAVA